MEKQLLSIGLEILARNTFQLCIMVEIEIVILDSCYHVNRFVRHMNLTSNAIFIYTLIDMILKELGNSHIFTEFDNSIQNRF